MPNEMDRFFDLLQAQNRELTRQGNMLATITQSQADTHERLFGANGQPGIVQYLHEKADDTKRVVDTHTKQISFWRGGIAVLAFLWAAAVAFASVIITRQR